MDENENRLWNWMEGSAIGRRMLAAKDRWQHAYYGHIDRYHQASQGFYRFWTRAGLVAAALLAMGAGYLVIRPCYRHYEEMHGQRLAEAFMAQGDYRNAYLSATRTLLLNASNVPACRVMAELEDLAHSPKALAWEQRIVDAQPTVENKLMLATAGLRYEKPPFPLATRILNALPDSATNNVNYHLVAASLAMASHRLAEAEIHFAAASKLAPTNKFHQLNLAILRLGMTNEARKADSRAVLETLSTDENVGPAALRALVSDRLANKDLSAANKYSSRLITFPQAGLADQLQNLGILQRLKSGDFVGRLEIVQRQSVANSTITNANAVADVSGWMQANGLVTENLRWLVSLPDSLRSLQPVKLATANGYLTGGDWKALRDFASEGNWGSLEYLRFALVSHACMQMGMSSLADLNWSSAVNEAENSYPTLVRLTELAAGWNMRPEKEDLLQRIVQRFPRERWAGDSLTQMYFSEGKTAAINQLADKLTVLYPTNTVFKNNLAATALLLKTNLPQAYQLAADAYASAPGNSDEATTYAYALHLQGRDREGLAVLEKLPPAELKKPTVALYYGILLAATGDPQEAASWLQLSQTNATLLPEEKQLLVSALSR